MPGIITITLNPAVDKTYVVDGLIPEHKLRCGNPITEAGGGGINVSKGLKELGLSSEAVFFAGGRNGSQLIEMLEREKIECKPILIAGETRESLVIIDDSTKKEYRIVVEGPSIAMSAFEEIVKLIVSEKPEFVIASGSLPKGVPEDTYAILAKTAKATGSKLILDTSGAALKAALVQGVYMMKPNLRELSSLSGVQSLKQEQVVQAARKFISDGKAEVIVVSMSSSGAMLVTGEMHQHIASPDVEQRSTVGAGDSMVSGMVWALQQRKSFLEMLCWGVACGSAATMNTETKLFKKADAENLFATIREKVFI